MNVDRLPLDQLGDKVGVIDLFVCCVSYEERCLDIANAIASGLIRNAIVAENGEGLLVPPPPPAPPAPVPAAP